MNRFKIPAAALIACMIAAPDARAQASLPTITQLPNHDFVYTWGSNSGVDARRRPDFTITGFEDIFRCTLTGRFKPASRMRDYYELRQFEQQLSETLYFITDSTETLNSLYLNNQVDWAVLDCIIPEGVESDDETQQKLQKAIEKAERQRERRRAREDRESE